MHGLLKRVRVCIWRKYVAVRVGQPLTTLPISTTTAVFVAGKTIGGGDDTAALSASGKLKPLLQEAGAL